MGNLISSLSVWGASVSRVFDYNYYESLFLSGWGDEITGKDKFSTTLSTSFKKIEGRNDLPANWLYLDLSVVLS